MHSCRVAKARGSRVVGKSTTNLLSNQSLKAIDHVQTGFCLEKSLMLDPHPPEGPDLVPTGGWRARCARVLQAHTRVCKCIFLEASSRKLLSCPRRRISHLLRLQGCHLRGHLVPDALEELDLCGPVKHGSCGLPGHLLLSH